MFKKYNEREAKEPRSGAGTINDASVCFCLALCIRIHQYRKKGLRVKILQCTERTLSII